MSKAILNLGAGNRLMAGAVNHDLAYHRKDLDVCWDLNAIPWPWADETFDEVWAMAVLEHLIPSLARTMNEIWRITKPDGIAHIKLPYWHAEESYSDPTHLHFASLGSFDHFDPRTKRGEEYMFYHLSPWLIQEVKTINDPVTSIYGELKKVTHYG